MQSQQTKVLKWAKAYDLGDLYDIAALSGYVVAAVEGGMHGVRLNLVDCPDELSHRINGSPDQSQGLE